MKRVTYLTMAMVAVTFCSQAWLGTGAPAQAATVTDTFELKVTSKEWCQDNPKFFENINVKAADNITLPSRAMSLALAISPIFRPRSTILGARTSMR